jgi:hypothetical protein
MHNSQTQGGRNNKKGNRYEDFFAVARCVELTDRNFDLLDSVIISEQSEDFVDDLYVETPTSREWYQ